MKTIILLVLFAIANILVAQEWVVQHEGETVALQSVYFIDKDIGYAVGGGTTLHTINGGETWVNHDTLGTIIWRRVTGPKNSNTIYTCGVNGKIGKLENGTFTLLNSGTTKMLNGITFLSEDTGYAVGEDGLILKTTNAGGTWAEQNSGTSAWLTNVGGTDSNCVIAVGDSGTILQTTNGGSTWEDKSVPNVKVYLSGMIVRSVYDAWLSGSEGVILHINRDSVETFTIETHDGIMAMGDVYNKSHYGVGDNGMVISYDGEQWKIETSNTSAWLNDVQVVVENSVKRGNLTAHIWAVGTSGTIIKKTIEIVGVEETIFVKKYSLTQNYPNPFNPNTTISFSLPNTEFTTLKVYDVLGKEVTTLFNEELSAGNHNKIWDASKFSSGVYFYKLQAGKFSETKKMILTK